METASLLPVISAKSLPLLSGTGVPFVGFILFDDLFCLFLNECHEIPPFSAKRDLP